MRCPKCGSENTDGKILCRTCGTRLRVAAAAARGQAGPAYESDEELRRRVSFDLTRVVWVTALVIAAGLALGFLFK